MLTPEQFLTLYHQASKADQFRINAFLTRRDLFDTPEVKESVELLLNDKRFKPDFKELFSQLIDYVIARAAEDGTLSPLP